MKDLAVALDMGNSGGKMLAASITGGKLEILDESVITNDFVSVAGGLYWDVFHIFGELKKGLRRFSTIGDVKSLGVDGTSGCYGFVGKSGRLAGQVASSRDGRYFDSLERIQKKIPLRELYFDTGVYPLNGYGLCRLNSDMERGELNPDSWYLQLSGLMRFYLTGEIAIERSMAGASMLMDKDFSDWNWPLVDRLGIPSGVLPRIVEPASVGLPLLPEVARETHCPNCRFVSTVEFDSSTAMLSAPGFDKDRIYLSMGTTINPGVELDAPIISDAGYEYLYKNVPLWSGSYMLLSDVPGFFLLSECLKFWQRDDPSIGHGELIRMAETAKNSSCLNIFDTRLRTVNPDMPETIREFCRESGQSVPESIGEVCRCIFESYAVALKWSTAKLKEVTGRSDYVDITAISGGARNALLCQMISDACGMKLRAGDPMATALGNLLVQFYAMGEIHSLDEMRELAGTVCPMREHTPKDPSHYDELYRFAVSRGWLKD